jgi:hypothetical protein
MESAHNILEELIESGMPINEISQIAGVGKSTLYAIQSGERSGQTSLPYLRQLRDMQVTNYDKLSKSSKIFYIVYNSSTNRFEEYKERTMPIAYRFHYAFEVGEATYSVEFKDFNSLLQGLSLLQIWMKTAKFCIGSVTLTDFEESKQLVQSELKLDEK